MHLFAAEADPSATEPLIRRLSTSRDRSQGPTAHGDFFFQRYHYRERCLRLVQFHPMQMFDIRLEAKTNIASTAYRLMHITNQVLVIRACDVTW